MCPGTQSRAVFQRDICTCALESARTIDPMRWKAVHASEIHQGKFEINVFVVRLSRSRASSLGAAIPHGGSSGGSSSGNGGGGGGGRRVIKLECERHPGESKKLENPNIFDPHVLAGCPLYSDGSRCCCFLRTHSYKNSSLTPPQPSLIAFCWHRLPYAAPNRTELRRRERDRDWDSWLSSRLI